MNSELVQELAHQVRNQAAAIESFLASNMEKEAVDLVPKLVSATRELALRASGQGHEAYSRAKLVSELLRYGPEEEVQIFIKGEQMGADFHEAYHEVGRVTGFGNGPGVIIEVGEVRCVG